jgi:hypothetical protein
MFSDEQRSTQIYVYTPIPLLGSCSLNSSTRCVSIRFCVFLACQGSDYFGGAIALTVCAVAPSIISDSSFLLCFPNPSTILGVLMDSRGGGIAADLAGAGSITISRCCGTKCHAQRGNFIFLRYLTGASITDVTVLECGKAESDDSALGSVYWTADASVMVSVTNLTSCWTQTDGSAVYRADEETRGSNPSSLLYLTVFDVSAVTGVWAAGSGHTVDSCNCISNPVARIFWLSATARMTISGCCFQGNTGVTLFNGNAGAKFDIFSCYFDASLPSGDRVVTMSGNIESTKRSLIIYHLSTFLCAASPGCRTPLFVPSAGFPPSNAFFPSVSPAQTAAAARSLQISSSGELDSSQLPSPLYAYRSSSDRTTSPPFSASFRRPKSLSSIARIFLVTSSGYFNFPYFLPG